VASEALIDEYNKLKKRTGKKINAFRGSIQCQLCQAVEGSLRSATGGNKKKSCQSPVAIIDK
jgi:hypothetical protein